MRRTGGIQMKKISLSCLLLAAMACSTSTLAAEKVFGLTWLSTPAQVRAAGVRLTPARSQGRLSMFESHSMPINLSDADSYLLVFDKQMGLVKMMMVGKDITHDRGGDHGRKRFAEIGRMLASRGYRQVSAKTIEHTDHDKAFYPCLASAGCGVWKQVYRKGQLFVAMQLRGSGAGRGYIVMSFEKQPQFDQAVKLNQQSALNKDAQAF